MDREGGGGGRELERCNQEEAQGRWVRRRTQFVVVVSVIIC